MTMELLHANMGSTSFRVECRDFITGMILFSPENLKYLKLSAFQRRAGDEVDLRPGLA
jgi:hypothetical protein